MTSPRDAHTAVTSPRIHLSLDQARRIALAAQGFGRPRPSQPVALALLPDTIATYWSLRVRWPNRDDESHAGGSSLAVVLDIVYNHLGPEGTCLAD